MSVVSALERIERWAQQNDPAFVALLQPGLTRQEIDDTVSGLPFSLAEEVYELYQWRNGQDWGEFRLGLCKTSQYRFMPLMEAVHEWDGYLNESYRDELENLNPIAAQIGSWPEGDAAVLEAGGWLPLFQMDSDYKVSLGAKKTAATSPIAYVSHDGPSAIFYASLTAMLEFHADVYESGALRLSEEMDTFFDYTITSAIVRRHFPDKVAQAEEEYSKKSNLDRNRVRGTPDRPTKAEFEQFDLVWKLARTGSLQAVPAVEAYLAWLLDDAEQAKQITQDLVHSPYKVMREWPHKRSLLVQNLWYSFDL